MLHQAWTEGKTNLVVLDAMGGTGKSALINRFIDDLRNMEWGGAERVFAWSFYSQGTDDKRQGDADGFLNAALDWFQYRGKPIKGNERGRALAKLIRQKRTLMVLDGLEPLQYPAHSPGKEGSLRVTGLEGQQKDNSIAELIKALADQMNGLVIITTRIPIPELRTRTEPSVIRRELNQLSTDAGVTLLRVLGVKAGEDDLRQAVDLLKGHALSLNLLATYSRQRLRGLLPIRKEIEDLVVDENLGGHSYVMMRRYEILLEDRANEGRDRDNSLASRELAILYMIGLFDRPAEADTLAALKREPIEGLTDAVGAWDGGQWDYAVAALREVKLLLPEGAPGEIDAHPLVREYFGRRLRQTRPEAFRAANIRLYEHYKLKEIPSAYHNPILYGLIVLAGARRDAFAAWYQRLMSGDLPQQLQPLLPPGLRGVTPAQINQALQGTDDDEFNRVVRLSQPNTVKQMEPLFAAIAHACAADLQEAAFVEIYMPRIARGDDWYSQNKIGAYSADLSALAHFFETPFEVPSRNLRSPDQSLALSQAAFGLRALGRLRDAIPPMQAGLASLISAGDNNNGATSAGNLAGVLLVVGDVAGAIAAAKLAIKQADAMGSDSAQAPFRQFSMRAALADPLLMAGDLAAAETLLVGAEKRQAELQPDFPMLYSMQGYIYCDLLLAQGKAAIVKERAEQTKKWSIEQALLLDMALDTLLLGRSALSLGDLSSASVHLEQAVNDLEESGNLDDIPRGFLARAGLHRATGAWDLAASDLNFVDEVAERSGMKLYQADCAIERARLSLAREGAAGCAAASSYLQRARDIIEATRSRDDGGIERYYARPTPAMAMIEARMAILSGRREEASARLGVAQRWIDDGWRVHEREYAELSALLSGRPHGVASPAGQAQSGASPKSWWWQKFFGSA